MQVVIIIGVRIVLKQHNTYFSPALSLYTSSKYATPGLESIQSSWLTLEASISTFRFNLKEMS